MKKTALIISAILALTIAPAVGTAAQQVDYFVLMDVDKSGDVSREEIIAYFKEKAQGPTDEEVDAFIAHNDKDKSGNISAEEWKNRQQPPR